MFATWLSVQLKNIGRQYKKQAEDTQNYIQTHIERQEADFAKVFSPSAIQSVFELTDGCPRLINQVCDHAFILGASRGIEQVDGQLLEEGITEAGALASWTAAATAYSAHGIITLAGSRIYTSLADTDEVIDDALNRFEDVMKLV